MKLHRVYEDFILSMEGALRSATIKWYATKLKPLLEDYGEMEIDQIEIKHLRKMRSHLSKRDILYPDSKYRDPVEGSLSNSTIRAHLRATKRLFNWSVEENYLEENPAKRLRMPAKLNDPKKRHQRRRSSGNAGS